MQREFENEKGVEILPSNFAELTGKEAVPILERASRRVELTKGVKSEFWNGVRETFDGMRGWIEGNADKLHGKTIRIISGIALTTTLLTACGQTVQSATTEVLPSQRSVSTETQTPTETATATETATPRSELDLPIAKDFKDLEALPSLTLEQFNSDAFNQQIIDRQNRGVYPDFPADVVILSSKSPIILWNQDPILIQQEQKYGGTQMFKYKLANEDEWKEWKNPKKRQYQVVERYQIPVPEENRTDYGVVIRVKNNDGSYGFYKQIYLPYPGEKLVGPDLQVIYDFGDPGRIITAAYNKDAASCDAGFNKNSTIQFGDVSRECAVSNKGATPKPFEDWAKTGKLTNTYPQSDGSVKIDIPISTQSNYKYPSQFNP